MKKILVLSKSSSVYSCKKLKQQAKNYNIELDFFDPNRFALSLNYDDEKPSFELFYQADYYAKPYKIKGYDLALARFGASSNQAGFLVMQQLQAMAIPCVNNLDAMRLTRDKWASLNQLLQHNLPIINSQLFMLDFNPNLYKFKQDKNQPLIIKTLNGSQGKGVAKANNHASAMAMLDMLNSNNILSHTQDFIKLEPAFDLRLLVIDKKVIAAVKRTAASDDFRSNFHCNGIGETYNPSRDQEQIAIKACEVLDLDIAGVDLLNYNGKNYILEVNASPGFELIDQFHHQSIADEIIKYCLEKLKIK